MEVNGKKVKLQIWDTAGQERFKNITASYYRGGNGVLVVYDITDRESFENLNSWLIEIEKNANKNVYKLLIGNKCDLEEKRIKIIIKYFYFYNKYIKKKLIFKIYD